LIKWEFNEIKNKDYDLLISFAGEERVVAKQIAINISKAGYRVFYDEFELIFGERTYILIYQTYMEIRGDIA
jgi:hypothetical protein